MVMEDTISLVDFYTLNLQAYIENTIFESTGVPYVIASMILGNGRHFVCAYQLPDGSFYVIDDLDRERTDPNEYILMEYGIAYMLIVKKEHDNTNLELKIPRLCRWESNRCLADACVTFLLRLPVTWWESINGMWEAYGSGTNAGDHMDVTFPFLSMLLHTYKDDFNMTEARTVAVQKHLLAKSDGDLVYIEDSVNSPYAEARSCVASFFDDLQKLTDDPYNFDQTKIVMETNDNFISTINNIPSLVLELQRDIHTTTSEYTDDSTASLRDVVVSAAVGTQEAFVSMSSSIVNHIGGWFSRK